MLNNHNRIQNDLYDDYFEELDYCEAEAIRDAFQDHQGISSHLKGKILYSSQN